MVLKATITNAYLVVFLWCSCKYFFMDGEYVQFYFVANDNIWEQPSTHHPPIAAFYLQWSQSPGQLHNPAQQPLSICTPPSPLTGLVHGPPPGRKRSFTSGLGGGGMPPKAVGPAPSRLTFYPIQPGSPPRQLTHIQTLAVTDIGWVMALEVTEMRGGGY